MMTTKDRSSYAPSQYDERDKPQASTSDHSNSSQGGYTTFVIDALPRAFEGAYNVTGGDEQSRQTSQHATQNDPNMSADVWENLREIFADLDALSDRSENKTLLKKPIMHLRRLLQIHSELRSEEVALDKVHLGVLYEREWYLRKLQVLEAAIGPPPPFEQTTYEDGQDISAAAAFTRAVRRILYEDSNEFSLIGSRWQ